MLGALRRRGAAAPAGFQLHRGGAAYLRHPHHRHASSQVAAIEGEQGESELENAESHSNALDDSRQRKPLFFYIDTVFPIKFIRYDPRILLAQAEQDSLLDRIRSHLPSDTGHGFRVESVQPRAKDGGAFVRCSYIPEQPAPGQKDLAKEEIVDKVIKHYDSLGERPWYSWKQSRAHVVKGKPWLEDITNRFPASTLRVEFTSGPDLSQEQIYALFRPYGRIRDLDPQPKFANVQYTSIRSAAAARNSLYGYKVDTEGSGTSTSLRILYKERLKGHAARDWMTSHPRIVIPILAVLAGGLSYAIFDPIRAFFIKSKISHLFDFEGYRITKWLKKETIDRLGEINISSEGISGATSLVHIHRKKGKVVTSDNEESGDDRAGVLQSSDGGPLGKEVLIDEEEVDLGTGIERERIEAAEKLRLWLHDTPDTFVTITGPPGSGKGALVDMVSKQSKNVLIIDCNEISKQGRGSESKLVAALASQVGYFPQFQWASSLNNLVDIASVGLIGTKAGFATNLDVQIKQILDVTAAALKRLADDANLARERSASAERNRREMFSKESGFVENVLSGRIHDGRLDCIAGNGIMSEIGMGLEPEPRSYLESHIPPKHVYNDDTASDTSEKTPRSASVPALREPARRGGDYSQIYGPTSLAKAYEATRQLTEDEKEGKSSTADIDQIPVVIIRGFESKAGSPGHDVLYSGMADWAAALVENKVAHLVFVNDSVAVSRSLARALPSKPISAITLTDATSENAWQYVQKKLMEYGKEDLLGQADKTAIERLGGRLTDLETLIQKMRGGANIDEAIDDIITRSSTEIVKTCFGDDAEEAKKLSWTREQAWYLVKNLAKNKELSHAELLANSPFKDSEKALRALEQADVISISHRDGRSSAVRPGKPSYKTAFQILAENQVFASQNELALNNKAIATAQSTIQTSSDQLISLSKLFTGGKWIFGGTSSIPIEVAAQVDACLTSMHTAQEDLVKLNGQNKELKAKLSLA